MRNPNWTKEQLILSFSLYCKIPFGKISKSNPQIMQLADLIGRTPSVVGLKLSKLASFDPHLQARGIKGMKNVGKGDCLVFEEFQNNREAQQANTHKQESYIEFMAYCSDLRACIDLFYEGNERQKLEVFGIVVK